MTDARQLLKAGALALVCAATLGAVPAHADQAGMEKCGGIAKAGKNDCATNKHACAGQSVKDGDADDWVYVPAGTCAKLVGGKAIAAAKKG